jgi:uncharacterized membrane protein
LEFITHRKHAKNLANWERAVSLAGGSLLAISGIRKGWPGGLAQALAGALLIERGLRGHSLAWEILGIRTAPLGQGAETTSVPYELGLRVDQSIVINRPRPEVFRFFRNIANLARFTNHVQSVIEMGRGRSHWVVKGPAGRTVRWDAVIHNERENERIAWRTLRGADVDHAGSVLFRDAPGGSGTEVRVELQYNPPAGAVGAVLSRLWGEEPTQQIADDLRRLKQVLESEDYRMEDIIDIASEDSFPASDAPSYTR